MKFCLNIFLCSIFFCSCSNNNGKLNNNSCYGNFKPLLQENMLPKSDSLSSDAGLMYLTSRDSLCSDSLIYSEFIVSILDKHYKNWIVYRVLDNKTNWINLEEKLKENPNEYYGNVVLQNIVPVKRNEIIRVRSNSPYFKMPLKTIKASVFIEVMDLPLK